MAKENKAEKVEQYLLSDITDHCKQVGCYKHTLSEWARQIGVSNKTVWSAIEQLKKSGKISVVKGEKANENSYVLGRQVIVPKTKPIAKTQQPKAIHTIFSGKFDIDKLIFYHRKEAKMGNLLDNSQRYNFHCDAVDFLEWVKDAINNQQINLDG